jgi:hypothetical protein
MNAIALVILFIGAAAAQSTDLGFDYLVLVRQVSLNRGFEAYCRYWL